MESKIAMTFQSTALNASTSVMKPKQTITTTPINAAMTLSNQPVMTTAIVAKKMISAEISMKPTGKYPLRCFFTL
jgi:hypothetical protein